MANAINLLPLLPAHPSTSRHPRRLPSFNVPSSTLSTPIREPPQRIPSCSLSPSSEPQHRSSLITPPSTREEAISQAKTCLSFALRKPLSNPITLPTRKLKKQRQPRFRVEIALLDDSPESLTQLAQDVFLDMPIIRKGAKPTILVLWRDSSMPESAGRSFGSTAVNSSLGSVTPADLGSADLAVFMAPEASDLDEIKMVANGLDPKPVVLFNPKWGFEEEKDFAGGLGSFIGSFDVVYSFMGLEVKGILSRRKGVVFRCLRDGVVSGEGTWAVMVEEEGKNGELKMVSRFKKRPAIGEVEALLYNLMAANSPVTKSVKFLRDLASNVIGKKAK